ncbi:MAG TPA: hypothetical protein VE871_18635, partial [Longimicrobium sp.]|nr:hypothetical protein [Longimicrobium sp.]
MQTLPVPAAGATRPGGVIRSGPGTRDGRAATRRRRQLIVLVAVLAGALLRVMQYAVNRALWLDEALIVHNVLGRGFRGLMDPLEFGQAAPYGFLALERAAVLLLGSSEYALRLVPLLAGLGALALFPAVARRYVSAPARTVAVAVFALAPFLVYYASEVKQYSLDVLVATVVLWAAAELRDRRPGAAGKAMAAGVLGVWLSQPAVFMLAGAGLALMHVAVRDGDRRRMAMLAAVGAAWLASFAGSYAVSRRSLGDAEYLQAFWRDGFMPLPPASAAEWAWLPGRIIRLFREPLGVMGENPFPLLQLLQTAAGLALCAAGVAWMLRRRPLRVAVVGLPLVLLVAASAVRAYPFAGDYLTSGRVLLFLVPSLALLLGEGAARVWRAAPGGQAVAGRAAAAVAVALLLAPSLVYAAVSVPHARAEVKPLLQYAAEQRRPGDLLYVYYDARPHLLYYGARYGWTGADTTVGVCSR